MDLTGKTIGFAVTGSHCTYAEAYPQKVAADYTFQCSCKGSSGLG